MFYSNLRKTTLTALAGLALSMPFSHADPVPDPVSGDLYLGFRASGGNGGSVSYIVKLGQDSVFREAASGTSFAVSGLGDIGDDLTATYGSDWKTRDDLFWGIFGVRPSVSSIVYASRERQSASSPSESWPLLDQTSRNTTASQITSVLESIGGYKSREATPNSHVATYQENTADSSSYNNQVASAGTTDFGSLSEWTSIEGSFANGTSGTSLDLFRIAGSGVTRVGKFAIGNSGALTFTAVVAPVLPSISDQPDPITVFKGDDATFAVTATGGDLTYQWQKGTTDLVEEGNHLGVNTASLTVSNAQTADEGNYRVVITNPQGSVTSDAVSLKVDDKLPAPYITSSLAATGKINSAFSYQITANYEPASFNATGLPDGLTIKTKTGIISGKPTAAGKSSVTISAKNATGTTTATLVITIYAPPDVTEEPADKTVTQGGSTTFKVAVEGAKLTYQWQKNGEDVTDGANVSGATTKTLKLTNLQPGDSGDYTLKISGPGGDVTTDPAALTVEAIVLASEIKVQQPAGTNLVDGKASKNLGPVLLGETSEEMVFTIKNSGNANLTGLNIFRTGTNASDFAFTRPPVTTLAPDASTTFKVSFKPTAKGLRLAILQIFSNDADESPFEIELTGKGKAPLPEIEVFQPVGSSLVDGTAKKSFGTVVVGKSGTAKTFTIKNTGEAKLNGIAITKNGAEAKDFTVKDPAKTALAPGESTTFKVTFNPSAKGTRNAAIHIKSNDADESPFDIKLAGAGAVK